MHIVFALLFFGAVYAQKKGDEAWKTYPSNNAIAKAVAKQPDTTKKDTSKPGNVKIVQDFRLNKLLEKHVYINDSIGTVKGYRIQIFSSSGVGSKKEAQKVKTEFLRRYPKTTARLDFDSPNFKVRAGTFRTKLEALKFHNEIQKHFPHSFIITDEIELEELD